MAGIGTNIFASSGLSGSAQLSGDIGDQGALATQTYGPSAQAPTAPFSPRHGAGLGFWGAAAGVVLLVAIRQSLPR